MELVCKDSKHQSAMVKMLESGNKEKNFFFLDPGNANNRSILGQNFTLTGIFTGSSTPLVVVTVNKELFG